MMEPFFPAGYIGHSQSIPQESKLATYAALRNPSTGNGTISSNHISQSLASLTLNGSNSAHGIGNILGSIETGLFQKSGTYGQPGAEDNSPLGNGSPPISRDPTPVLSQAYQHVWVEQENVGGTTYYYAEESHQPEVSDEVAGPQLFPNFSVYSGPPLHLKDYSTRLGALPPPANPVVHPNPTQTGSFFMPEEIKQELLHKNSVTLSQPNRQLFPELPLHVDHYHELCPLESSAQKSATFGYPTTVYKAINSKNGFLYSLRRIHGFRFPSGKCLGLIDAWKQLQHCNLVSLREVFTTKAFGDNSLIFAYDYFPAAESLMTRHFERNNQANGYADPFNTGDPSVPRPYSHQKNALLRHHANMLPEQLLWTYIIQLSSAIRTIHTAGLSVRSLDPTKILVISRTRPQIRLNCCGIYDIVTFDPTNNPVTINQFHQLEDLLALGKLILALACNSLLATQRENLTTSLELITRTYSSDLRNLIVYLMNSRGSGSRTINDIMPMIGARFYNQLDAANARADFLESCLSKELENGRLFKLIVKLNSIVERQDMNMDPSWSETGDRYLLKLFRDFIFHQVTSDGRPWLDLSHVVHCLNRLDSGTNEKITLMTRDEQIVLITTFTELKVCLEQSFAEILTCPSPQLKHSPQHHPMMSSQ